MAKESLDIECPHCKEDNTITLSKEIKCKKCEKTLLSKKYSKKSFISATTAIVLGLGGGIYLDEKFETDRFPIEVEYKIIDSCISSDERALSKNDYKGKREICICAQKETEDEVTYSEYKSETNKFFITFEKNVKECM